MPIEPPASRWDLSVDMLPDEPWRGRLQRGEMQPGELQQAMRLYNNVIMETTVVMKAVKPASAA